MKFLARIVQVYIGEVGRTLHACRRLTKHKVAGPQLEHQDSSPRLGPTAHVGSQPRSWHQLPTAGREGHPLPTTWTSMNLECGLYINTVIVLKLFPLSIISAVVLSISLICSPWFLFHVVQVCSPLYPYSCASSCILNSWTVECVLLPTTWAQLHLTVQSGCECMVVICTDVSNCHV